MDFGTDAHPEWQADQGRSCPVGLMHGFGCPSEPEACRGTVKWHVVEDTADAVSLEIADQGISFSEASEADVEHVAVVLDVVGHRWTA